MGLAEASWVAHAQVLIFVSKFRRELGKHGRWTVRRDDRDDCDDCDSLDLAYLSASCTSQTPGQQGLQFSRPGRVRTLVRRTCHLLSTILGGSMLKRGSPA
jgi:hypothetical protein